MYLPRLIATRLLSPDEVLETGSSSQPSAVLEYLGSEDPAGDQVFGEVLTTKREEILREELDELLGLVPRDESALKRSSRPIKGRWFLREITQGVPRIELRLGSNRELPEWLSGEFLEKQVMSGRLSYFNLRTQGLEGYHFGDIAVVYTRRKARALGSPFLEEWRGTATSHHLWNILEAVRGSIEESGSSQSMRRTIRISSRSESESFLATYDKIFTDSSDLRVRHAVDHAGISWRKWCRAGRGLLQRLGLAKNYF